MSRSIWLEYIYKLTLMFLGSSMVSPGLGKATGIPHYYFNWTKENTRFSQEGGAHLFIPLDTNLVIKCPYLTPEYYRIYWVSEVGYNECRYLKNNVTHVIDCVDPETALDWTQEIKDFTGTPGGKDFQLNQSYYLATYSIGDEIGLGNKNGGACLTHKLKLKITIVDRVTGTTQKPTQTPPSTTKATVKSSTPSKSTTTTSTTTTQSTTTVTSQKPHPTDIPGITDIPIISVPDSTGGNTGTIDISSAQTLRGWSALVLSLCLSLLHILYLNQPYIQR